MLWRHGGPENTLATSNGGDKISKHRNMASILSPSFTTLQSNFKICNWSVVSSWSVASRMFRRSWRYIWLHVVQIPQNERHSQNIWAGAWQNKQKDKSGQLGHPCCLISLRCPYEKSLGPWLSLVRTATTDPQADLSGRWVPRLFVGIVVLRFIL